MVHVAQYLIFSLFFIWQFYSHYDTVKIIALTIQKIDNENFRRRRIRYYAGAYY